ncbi:probable pectinesterase 68 isoform X2 [Physcomitrium patens]|uniref:probable pectinesterase 68 isoform X2 n=1 Tax=Physcomitrium patens TaxID=3218 RepID=UPI000D179203|nr:probable pectinesterase 53 isoform X2 [Physcomitrium patens]|eukprot:XP_024390356.1 probable pectinesterase 53 isoform X2 [Physcomitrella patens]
MAENLVISVSRSIVTLSALVIFGNLLEQSHGQWWFPTAPTTTSPSSNSTNPTNSSTNIPPSASFTTPPVMSPSFSFPINPAGSNTSSTATPSTSIGFPTSPYASSSPPTTPTTSTTLIVMSNSFGFGPLTIYTSVQAAIDAVPENNTGLVTIEILSGTYTEKVSIPSNKPYITLQGTGRTTTIITYNDTANSTNSTFRSATFSVWANNFTARNLTFQNSAPHAVAGETGAQAVALLIGGDMAAFYGCGFLSSQDTICDDAGRHYFRDCYVEGNIDIIWGNGQSLYEGWSDWPTTVTMYNSSSRRLLDNSTIRHEYYGEYGNTGPGASLTYRVNWMHNLTEAEAANFSSLTFIDGLSWLASET